MKIITLGETLLRLSPAGFRRFAQAQQFDANYGGSESNVAALLGQLGEEAYHVTKLPANDIGQAAISALAGYGVRTDYIARGGDRIGIYYLETGASARPGQVIYDRAGSSIATARPEDFDFDRIFEGADWFHWSGIMPAISSSAAEITKAACVAAKKRGVHISCDLNYRSKLWSSEEAIRIMRPLSEYIDLCIGNEEHAGQCLGFKPAEGPAGEDEPARTIRLFRQMRDEFGFSQVVSTVRRSLTATRNTWKAQLLDGDDFYETRTYDIDPIVDRVGGGDAFAGGLIYGLNHFEDRQKALDFAIAAGVIKHTIPGDMNCTSAAEVLALAEGAGDGRLKR